jgi:hypothetical protein
MADWLDLDAAHITVSCDALHVAADRVGCLRSGSSRRLRSPAVIANAVDCKHVFGLDVMPHMTPLRAPGQSPAGIRWLPNDTGEFSPLNLLFAPYDWQQWNTGSNGIA